MIGFLKKYKYLIPMLIFVVCITGCSYNQNSVLDPKLQEIDNQKNIRMQDLNELGIETFRYTYNCSDQILSERFDKMSSDRWKVYFINPEDYGKKDVLGVYKEKFKTPENWEIWHSRYPYPLAFKYNLAYENYDASIILSSNKTKFLAIEAPSSKNISEFYKLFDIYKVSSFVKLNSSDEYKEDYYPFWSEKMGDDTHIKLGEESVNFLSYEWPHRQGADIMSLLNLIKNAQNVFDNSEFMAVSCRAGAGRTGTFIASYIIISQIDEQLSNGISPDDINIDIDKIVWEISVQRPFAITHKDQYKTLYRLVDYYIQNKNQGK